MVITRRAGGAGVIVGAVLVRDLVPAINCKVVKRSIWGNGAQQVKKTKEKSTLRQRFPCMKIVSSLMRKGGLAIEE